MTTDWRGPQGQLPDRRDGGDPPLRIRTCGRIGMQASPPRARLRGWLRRR